VLVDESNIVAVAHSGQHREELRSQQWIKIL
jgi:hypothetical protein